MKKIFVFAAAALMPMLAMAEDPAPARPIANSPPGAMSGARHGMPGGMGGGGMHRPGSLEDARRQAHEMTDRLDKMTPAEWDEMQKRREQMVSQWQKMTPEQREQIMKNRIERASKEGATLGGAAIPAPVKK